MATETPLEEHGKFHSDEHMAVMREVMNKGESFDKAHEIAMKQVGEGQNPYRNKDGSLKQGYIIDTTCPSHYATKRGCHSFNEPRLARELSRTQYRVR